MLDQQTHQDLMRYLDGGLSEEECRQFEERLEESPGLREHFEKARQGREWMLRLESPPMPPDRAARIRGPLGEHPALSHGGRPFPVWLAAAAALAVLAVSAALLLQLSQPSVQLRLAEDPPNPLEEQAFALHEDASQEPQGKRASMSLAQAQNWVREHSGMDLPTDTDPSHGDGISVQSAEVLEREGIRALSLRYQVDSHPVTLLIAPADQVPGAPEAAFLHKEISLRRPSPGLNSLSWTDGDQTYTLLSDLPDNGRKACLICHLSEDNRRKILALDLSS